MVFELQDRPVFDEVGNFWIPNNIPLPGKMNPKLSIREWFCWILDSSPNATNDHYDNLVGCRVTVWRARKSLKEKGYLSRESEAVQVKN